MVGLVQWLVGWAWFGCWDRLGLMVVVVQVWWSVAVMVRISGGGRAWLVR